MPRISYRYDRSRARGSAPTSNSAPMLMMLRRALEQCGQFALCAEGNSMQPTIEAGDRILVGRLDAPVQPGDIVVAQGRTGLYAHRVRFVGPNQILTMGDNNALLDKPLTRADILGVAKAKLVDGKTVPLGCLEFRAPVSFRLRNPLVITVAGYTEQDRRQLCSLAETFAIEIRYCARMAEVLGAIHDEEYAIGICEEGPESEAGIVAALELLPRVTKVNFVLGAQYGYAGNDLGLLPHSAVNMLARIGGLKLRPLALPVTASYLVGLVQNGAFGSGQP